jgi:hypothetical protein
MEVEDMPDLEQVTYCGLYCGLCAARSRIPQRSRDLRDAMQKEGWNLWGADIPGFTGFWEFLGGLAEGESGCSCRGKDCGPPFCGIRKCARSRGVEVCAFCPDFPCHRIEGLAKGYVMLMADAARMREIGIEAWIAEQEVRRAAGVVYADIRCEPYDVPED